MPLGTEIGLAPDDILLDGDPALPSQRGGIAPFSSFRPITIKLGMQVGLGPGRIVLDGYPAPFGLRPMSIVAKRLEG